MPGYSGQYNESYGVRPQKDAQLAHIPIPYVFIRHRPDHTHHVHRRNNHEYLLPPRFALTLPLLLQVQHVSGLFFDPSAKHRLDGHHHRAHQNHLQNKRDHSRHEQARSAQLGSSRQESATHKAKLG